MSAPNPYAVVEYNGRPMLNVDKAMVMKMEHALGYGLTVVQGIGGAPASEGYHLKGRMLDLADWRAEQKNRVAKDSGCISWIRDERDSMAGHLHLGVIFENRQNQRGISAGGFGQISSFDLGLNGLANGARDRDQYRPSPRRQMSLDEYRFVIQGGLDVPPPNNVTRMRDHMVEAIHALTQAIHEGKEVDGRPAVESALAAMKQERREIRERLEKMPQR